MSNYVETRYYDAGGSDSNQDYSELVKKTTAFNTDSNTYFINSNIYDYFSLSNFKRLSVDDEGSDAKITLDLRENKLKDALNLSSSNNSNLNTYMVDELNNLEGNTDFYIDLEIIEAARHMIKYYVASSALYGFIYSDREVDTTNTNTIYTIDENRPEIELTGITIHIGDNDRTTRGIIEQLHGYYQEAVEKLKKSDPAYNNSLGHNIRLNNRFLNNNDNLIRKEEIFDTKKAFAITMMAKSHKANKLYAKKQFWFMIYMIIFLVYLFGILGMIFAGGSSFDLFNSFQTGMTGLVIVIINLTILVGLFINEIIKYFNK